MPKIERAILKNPVRDDPNFEGRRMAKLEREAPMMALAGTLQQVVEYRPIVREYWVPFNYDNFCVELGRTDPYVGAEFNGDGVELDIPRPVPLFRDHR